MFAEWLRMQKKPEKKSKVLHILGVWSAKRRNVS
jgi:hypothetical protein